MKNSYKLFNLYLDGRKVDKQMIDFQSDVDYSDIPNITEKRNLFDNKVFSRKICGLDLLKFDSSTKLREYTKVLQDCHELIIILDYHISIPIVQKFFIKRVTQASELLKEWYPLLTITIVDDTI